MEIFISIDGVLRNTIQKFYYHYNDAYLNSEFENETNFDYGIIEPIQNNILSDCFKFQSKEEFDFFFYIEYPIEIFGHAGLSYATTFTDLNRLIHDNPEHNFTIVGLNEFGKSKPASLFFLSKNGFLGNTIKFIKSNQIKDNWDMCDYWITDSKEIIESCPQDKVAIKFNTQYNKFFTHTKEIAKLTEIQEEWSKSLEKTTTSTLTESQKSAEPEIQ